MWISHSKITQGKIILLFIIMAGVAIMFVNTFTHPPEQSYDYTNHLASIAVSDSITDWMPYRLPKDFEYNPVLYYYAHLIEIIVGRTLQPYYYFRLIHISFILLLAYLYGFSLLSHLKINPKLSSWFVLGMFLIPNIYLSQVMVRGDHLLLLLVNLFFYLWWRYDLPRHLAHSKLFISIWVIMLIAAANTRHFALPAFTIFFIWGIVILLNNKQSSRSSINYFKIITLGVIIVVLSSLHYANRLTRVESVGQSFVTGGNSNNQSDFSRGQMFTNIQFNKLWRTPSRGADFREGHALWPRLYGDMWADHWLYFSGSFDKGIARPDEKERLKQIVLIAAIPLTILYFGLPLIHSANAISALLHRSRLTWWQTSALLFVGAVLMLIILNWADPRLPNNDNAKFGYLLAYMWLPFFSILAWIQQHPRFLRYLYPYTVFLFLLCLPLYFYPTLLQLQIIN
jgi:hypothetical protein